MRLILTLSKKIQLKPLRKKSSIFNIFVCIYNFWNDGVSNFFLAKKFCCVEQKIQILGVYWSRCFFSFEKTCLVTIYPPKPSSFLSAADYYLRSKIINFQACFLWSTYYYSPSSKPLLLLILSQFQVGN